MHAQRSTVRELKKNLAELLLSEPFAPSLERIQRFDARQAVSPLFGFFCSRNQLQRWRAVTAIGALVAQLADANMESARVVMRRFIWNLNEESGGIGWGCPEAMGECMARSDRLADEYSAILLSYLHPARNFIEHPALQEGVLWGLGRLAHARSTFVADGAELFMPFLGSSVAALRGLAAWACGPLTDGRLTPLLRQLEADRALLQIYRREQMETCSVGELAAQALQWTRAGSAVR